MCYCVKWSLADGNYSAQAFENCAWYNQLWQEEGGCARLKLWFGKCFKPTWACDRYCLCAPRAPQKLSIIQLKFVSSSEGFQVNSTAHVSHLIHYMWELPWLKGQAKWSSFISVGGGRSLSWCSTGPRGTHSAQCVLIFQFLRITWK